jgi:hypothetical protein
MSTDSDDHTGYYTADELESVISIDDTQRVQDYTNMTVEVDVNNEVAPTNAVNANKEVGISRKLESKTIGNFIFFTLVYFWTDSFVLTFYLLLFLISFDSV